MADKPKTKPVKRGRLSKDETELLRTGLRALIHKEEDAALEFARARLLVNEIGDPVSEGLSAEGKTVPGRLFTGTYLDLMAYCESHDVTLGGSGVREKALALLAKLGKR